MVRKFEIGGPSGRTASKQGGGCIGGCISVHDMEVQARIGQRGGAYPLAITVTCQHSRQGIMHHALMDPPALPIKGHQ